MSKPGSLPDKLQEEMGGLASAISDTLSAFRELEQPLVETHGEVPRAASQLDKATQQTEKATSQMLDVLEEMTRHGEELVQGLEQLRRDLSSQSIDTPTAESLAALQQRAGNNLDCVYQLMDAMQFQDVTSQQINYAASMLDNIGARLRRILERFGPDTVAKIEPVHTPRRPVAFDPEATLESKEAAQDEIDSLFDSRL